MSTVDIISGALSVYTGALHFASKEVGEDNGRG